MQDNVNRPIRQAVLIIRAEHLLRNEIKSKLSLERTKKERNIYAHSVPRSRRLKPHAPGLLRISPQHIPNNRQNRSRRHSVQPGLYNRRTLLAIAHGILLRSIWHSFGRRRTRRHRVRKADKRTKPRISRSTGKRGPGWILTASGL